MKRLIIIGAAVLFVGCGQEKAPELPANPGSWTEEERTAEIQRMLDQVGVKLPDNWEEMDKQERGAFLLPVLLQVDVVPE